ncbi:MAG: hypothetical protein U9O94_07000, partial [Nanoarchaeota archaeon]|nr:hypothetical protein [Nanoarchaeota archaeon]
NSHERLQNRADEIDSLANLSEQLLSKFNRTEGIITSGAPKDPPSLEKSPLSIIRLFNSTSDQMGKSIDNIGNNLETLLNLID